MVLRKSCPLKCPKKLAAQQSDILQILKIQEKINYIGKKNAAIHTNLSNYDFTGTTIIDKRSRASAANCCANVLSVIESGFDNT